MKGIIRTMRMEASHDSAVFANGANFQLDKDGRVARWPSETERFTGLRQVDLIGRPLDAVFSEISDGTLDRPVSLLQICQSQIPCRAFADDRFFHLTIAPFLSPESNVLGYTVFLQTHSDEKTEQQKESRKHQRTSNATSHSAPLANDGDCSPPLDEHAVPVILKSVSDMVIVHERGGVIANVNDQVCRNLGYSRDELIGQDPSLFSTAMTRSRTAELTEKLDAGGAFSFETNFRRKDGSEFPVEVNVSAYWRNGERMSVSAARDQTRSHRERKRLAESEERLQLALDAVQLGTWKYSMDTRMVSLDKRCQHLWGVDLERMPIEELMRRIHPDDLVMVKDTVLNAIADPPNLEAVGLEHRLLMPDGCVRWISIRAVAHYEAARDDGATNKDKASSVNRTSGNISRPISMVGTMMDISNARHAALSLRGQTEIFEAIAIGQPLNTILKQIIRLIEDQIPGAICSILEADPDGKKLHFAEGENVPEELRHACSAIPIGTNGGTCGLAASRRQSVICADILNDERLQRYHDLFRRLELGACWSVPISGAKLPGSESSNVSSLLGTFAVYRRTTGSPDRRSQTALATGSRLASIAISASRAVQEIRESDERYTLISQITRSVTFAMSLQVDGTWHFDWCRPEFGLLSGYTQAEMNANGLKSLFHPDDHQLVDELVNMVFQGETVRKEIRYLTKDRQVLFVQLNAKLLSLDNKTGTASIIGGLLDITEQKTVEQALRKSEERFQLALAGANDGLWDWNLRTNDVFYSPRWMKMLGYQPDEWPGTIQTWIALLHPEDDRSAQMHVQNFLKSRLDHFKVEYRLRHKDGSYRNILSRGLLARDEHGKPTRLVGTHQDLTEHKRSEMALRRSESYLRRAQTVANLGRWEFNLKSRQFHACSETARIYGLNTQVARMADLRRLVHPDDRKRVFKLVASIVAGQPFEMEHRIIVGGATRWVSVKAATEQNEQTAASHLWGISQDITARKQLEEQFQQAHKMEAFGQLAGGVAHDFNNLLTVINGSADLLLQTLESDNSSYPEISQIRIAGERAATMTRQLLALSRQQFTEPKVQHVNEIVSHSEGMFRRLIGEDIQIETYLQDPLPPVKVGSGQLDQVLLNLAVNARDAMPNGGRLIIETRLVQEHDLPDSVQEKCNTNCVRISVTDTGMGMLAEVKNRIFEPFFSTKGIGKGTGLGLATVYGIVQQNNGAVAVESSPGSGTRFDIFLPACDSTVRTTPKALTEKPVVKGRETVLLVEDEELVRQLAIRVLTVYGYEVLEASSGEAAILIATQHQGSLHLLLTDVVMPGMSGTELAKQLRKIHPDLRVLFMSGYTDDDVLRRGVFTEQDEFLQKPFAPTSLIRRIQEMLADEPAPEAC